MARPSDWSLLGGSDPAPGRVEDVNQLLSYWANTGAALVQGQSRLSTTSVNGLGLTVTQIRTAMAQVSAAIGNYTSQAHDLESGTRSWAGSLQSIQERGDALWWKAQYEQDELTRLAGVQTQLSAVPVDPEAPADHDHAQQVARNAQALQDAQNALAKFRFECDALREEYRAAAGTFAAGYKVVSFDQVLAQVSGGGDGEGVLGDIFHHVSKVLGLDTPAGAGVGLSSAAVKIADDITTLLRKTGDHRIGGSVWRLFNPGAGQSGPWGRFKEWFKKVGIKSEPIPGSLGAALPENASKLTKIGTSLIKDVAHDAPTLLKLGAGATKVLGPVGAVVGAGVSGWQQWESDSQAHPDMPQEEKIVRTGAVAGTSAVLGGFGVWGGAAAGAAIGSIFPGPGTVIGGIVVA